ncbi:MAG: hypothetical protein Q9213_002758 [Squamulea squamosa]
MHYSSIVTLALVSAVIAVPTPQDSGVGDTAGSGGAQADQIANGKSGPINTDFSAAGDGPLPTAVDTATASSTGVETTTSVDDSTISTPAATGSGAVPTGLLPCGEAFYSPDQYTCYETFLCPIIDGTPTRQCGDACYLESLYTCVDDVLQSINATSGTGTGETPTTTTSPDTTTTDTGAMPTTTGTGSDTTTTGPDTTTADTGATPSPTFAVIDGSGSSSYSSPTGTPYYGNSTTPDNTNTSTSGDTSGSTGSDTTTPPAGTEDSTGSTGGDSTTPPMGTESGSTDPNAVVAGSSSSSGTGAGSGSAPGGKKARREWMHKEFKP